MATQIQIGCYFHPAEADALEAYARSLGLSRPKLCALLIVRAVRSNRLGMIADFYGGSEPKARARRVTTRLEDDIIKELFIQKATELHLGIDDAAAKVFRAELNDRWLEKAVSR